MNRRHGRRLYSNPLVVGALTILVAIMAVALAYNANTGLPFVPSYTLHVDTSNAEELQKGDQVDMGGANIGVVGPVTAAHAANGGPMAILSLKLNKSVEPLPVDSRFVVRLKGSIGLKYLQVVLGRASRGYPNGATVPLGHTAADVDFDQVLSMFTPPTRAGVQHSTVGLGEALAGRGYDLNQAIGAFVPLVDDLSPVMRRLASAKTGLAGFFRGLERYNAASVPVAQTQGRLFGNLAATFHALASVAPAFQQTIAETPAAFQATISGGPVIRPFLTQATSLLRALRPGAATLTQSAPVLASAFAIGTRTLPPTAGLDTRVVGLSKTLQDYGATPAVQQGLDRLTLTAVRLRAPLAFLTPVQSSCNYITLLLRNLASVLSDHGSQGGLARVTTVLVKEGQGLESGPSARPYTGRAQTALGPLHVNPYPDTDSPGELPECAAGNEPYSGRHALIGNPPGRLSRHTETTRDAG